MSGSRRAARPRSGGRTRPASRCRARPRRGELERQRQRLGAVRRLAHDGKAGLAVSSTWRMPVRTIAWSSATSTRMGGSVTARPPRARPGRTISSAARRPAGRRTGRSRPTRRCAPACRPDPCGPRARAARRCAAGGPRPSSCDVEPDAARVDAMMPTSTFRAPAWRRTLDSASCSARNRASSASLESGGSAAGTASATADVAPVAEIGDQRAERREQAEVVQQRRPEVVGDAADAPDAGVDQLERPIEPRPTAPGATPSRRSPSSIFTAENTCAVSSCSSRESRRRSSSCCSHHAGGEPGQLDGAVVQPGVEVGVLQRGAHLLAQGDEKPVVERGERIARVAHQHQGADHVLASEQRQHRGVGKCGRAGLAPVTGELRPAGLAARARAPRRGGVERGLAPPSHTPAPRTRRGRPSS